MVTNNVVVLLDIRFYVKNIKSSVYIMPRIEVAGNHTRIYLASRSDLDITRIYNHNFFKMMGLNVTIDAPRNRYVETVDEDIVSDNEPLHENDGTKPNSTIPIPIKSDENADLVDIVFGPEKIPNGYTDLPLDLTKSDEPIQTQTQVDNVKSKTFFYKMQDYVGSFIRSNQPVPTIPGEDIVITIPHDNSEEIQSLDLWRVSLLQPPYSIFGVADTNITYETLENVLSDLLGQLEYFHSQKVTFRELIMDNVYVIKGRFVILDSETMIPDDKSEYRDMAVNVIYQLVGKGVEFLQEIKNTRLYGDMIEIQ